VIVFGTVITNFKHFIKNCTLTLKVLLENRILTLKVLLENLHINFEYGAADSFLKEESI
jgi:hypothetical protein